MYIRVYPCQRSQRILDYICSESCVNTGCLKHTFCRSRRSSTIRYATLSCHASKEESSIFCVVSIYNSLVMIHTCGSLCSKLRFPLGKCNILTNLAHACKYCFQDHVKMYFKVRGVLRYHRRMSRRRMSWRRRHLWSKSCRRRHHEVQRALRSNTRLHTPYSRRVFPSRRCV